MALPTSLDKDAIREAYEDVRSNMSDHEWAVFKFDGLKIVCSAKGQGFQEFCAQFHDDERAFGYIRIQMGDEMSKRSKFLFLTWIGPEVGVMQRAKMSTDKSIIKDVINVSGGGCTRDGGGAKLKKKKKTFCLLYPSPFLCSAFRTLPSSCRWKRASISIWKCSRRI